MSSSSLPESSPSNSQLPGSPLSTSTGENILVERPFVIELEQLNRAPNGHFQPQASLKLSPSLRTSGLLRALPPEDVAWLMFLLTFLSPNGDCRAHLELLSEAMRVSRQKAAKRMEHLASFRWQGEPIIVTTRHETGMTSYSLSPGLITHRDRPPTSATALVGIGGFGDTIVARSRETYAHPRAQVERMIEEQYSRRGHHSHGPAQAPETEETEHYEDTDVLRELRRRLENVGMAAEQAEHLVRSYSPDHIERQLEWLPYRNAKNPAGFLFAAIEGDYDEPLSHRFLGIPKDDASIPLTENSHE